MAQERVSGRFDFEDSKTGLSCDAKSEKGRSRTLQSFSKEANINNIIAKYRKTGILVDPITQVSRTPFYGDFSGGEDYFSQMTKLTQVKEDFDRLPAAIRTKFGHDVGKMLDFVSDPANLEESVKLGLLPKELLPVVPMNVDSKGNATPVVPPVTPPGV